MAKKKVSQKEKSSEEKIPMETPKTMENNLSEKLANLKSLNAMLLRETVERREQVHSLEVEIDRLKNEGSEDQSIEAEIRKGVAMGFVSEKIEQEKDRLKEEMWREKEELKGLLEEKCKEIDLLNSDFSRYRDEVRRDLEVKRNESDGLKSLVLELENRNEESGDDIRRFRMEHDGLVEEKRELERRVEDLKREIVDVGKQRQQLEEEKKEQQGQIKKLNRSLDAVNAELDREKDTLEAVICEREEIRNSLQVQVEETEKLKLQLLELENCNSATEEELSQSRAAYRRLKEERKESERKLELVGKEKDLVKANLVESTKYIAELKREIENIAREKEVGEQERGKHINDLQMEIEGLQTLVLNLEKNEEELLGEVSELEKSNAEAIEEQKRMQLQIGKLVEEKSEIGRKFELLLEEKQSTMSSLEESLLQLEAEKKKMFEITHEKDGIEKVKQDQEVKIINLLKEVSGLKATVSTLEESSQNHVQANTQFQSDLGEYKVALENVSLERDCLRNEANCMEREEKRLKLELLELEKRNAGFQQELERVRIEHCKLLEEKKNSVSVLTEEKVTLEKKLLKAEEGIQDLQAKMESSDMFTDQALQMLKKTMQIVCDPEDAGADGKEDLTTVAGSSSKDIQPFAAELEAIRRAFNNMKGRVDDMNRQYESLKLSMIKAQKKQNFWAWLSSATVVAAASIAYVSRLKKGG